jgi:hypothetical protein
VVAVNLLGLLVALAATGCAGRRIEQGVFHSTKGYRVRLPGSGWTVVEDSRADLELRAHDGQAGMLANATCETHVARRSVDVLGRQLLLGLADRRLIERDDVVIGRWSGTRTVLEAAGERSRIRIEALTVVDRRCVYDLIYAAPVDVFTERQNDFAGFVASFTTER